MDNLKSTLINNNWFTDSELKTLLNSEIDKCIKECVRPNKEEIFSAFDGLKPQQVKVLIIGQDPYPDVDRAHGLAFSFKNNQKAEDSLQNIFNKIEKELGIANKNTNLECWRDRGVLLLNTALTYKKGEQDKHIKNWKTFVNKIISKLLSIKGDENNPLVIMLWGCKANKLKNLSFKGTKEKDTSYYANKYPHIKIIRCSHPSYNWEAYKNSIFNGEVPSFKDCVIFKDDLLKGFDWSTD